MLKKIILLGLIKKIILLIILIAWGGFGAQAAVKVSYFNELFPESKSEGMCNLTRLDDCKITVVPSDNTYDEIAIIFVQHTQRQKSMATAKRLVELFGQGSIQPFAGSDSSVAIYFDLSKMVQKQALSVLFPNLKPIPTLQFISLQGKSMRVQVDMPKQSTANKKKRTMEMLINLDSPQTSCVEFVLTKGRATPKEMQEFIMDSMLGSISVAAKSSLTLTPKTKKNLRSIYSNADIIVYSNDLRFCIVQKNKTYYAGDPDSVKAALSNNNSGKVAFNYPAEDQPWPDVTETSGTDTATADTPPYTDTSIPYGESVAYFSKIDPKISEDALKESIHIDTLMKKFPGGERKDACYIFRIDNCRVIMHVGYNDGYAMKDTELVIVSSTISQDDALETARGLAQLISPKCEVAPFAGTQPHAVIYMPGLYTLTRRLYSPLNLIFYPRPDYIRNTRFIRWEGGMLVAQVKVDRPGAKGTVEVTINPMLDSNYSGVKLRVIEGEVDIQHFLDYGYRMWGSAVQPTPQMEEQIIKETGCKKVISYKPDGLQYTLLYMGDNTYYCGSYRGTNAHVGLPKKLQQGFSALAVPFPSRSIPRPTATEPEKSTQEVDLSNAKGSDFNATESVRPAESKANAQPTPLQLYKKYIQKLLSM